MAQAGVQPPERLNFAKPEDWQKWIKRFERYITVADIKDDVQNVKILIYAMGPQAEDILLMFGLNENESKDYATVKDKFNGHFMVRRNVIFERARFNSRNQYEGESIESFFTELHALIEYCDYGEKRDNFLRDKIVVGIRDKRLSESLQLDEKLTLDTALNKVRSKEMVVKQSQQLSDISSARADVIRKQKQQKQARPHKPETGGKPKNRKQKVCHRCGNRSHKYAKCPARDTECYVFGKS